MVCKQTAGLLRAALLGATLLPAGGYCSLAAAQSAQAAQGAALYNTHCTLCHGADGRRGQGFGNPIWGPGQGLGKFNTAQGLIEYIQLTMPFDNPQKMNDKEKLAVVAFLLERNGIPLGGELNHGSASKISIK